MRSPRGGRKVAMTMSVRRGIVIAMSLTMLAAACGGDENPQAGGGDGSGLPGEGKPPVTIGTKDFTEEFILGELYTQALEAKGYTVELKSNIGSTEIIDKALVSGEIDAYPEYTGVAVAVSAGKDIIPKSAEETLSLAKEFYESRGQTVSEATPFFDVDAIATTKETADAEGLTTVADLKKLGSFTVGARPEFKDRYQGFRGMQEVYGLTDAKFKQLAFGLQYQALDSGDIEAANVFSTDAQLAGGKYTVLEDPEGVFGFQNVVFVIDQAKLDELGPDFMGIINDVNALLTNDAMQAMNAAVDIDKQEPTDVAKDFLDANGML
jgi:osmoprotectant transport system substrate-binding protein